jgi:hypothetical protein
MGGAGLVLGAALDPPTLANADRRRIAPACPDGQVAGLPASLIGRRSSKSASHTLQRNS